MDKKYIILMIVAIVIIAAAVSVYTTHTSERKNTLALDDKQIANITVNMNNWSYDSANDIYYQLNLSYCNRAKAPEYETLSIYVPGKYFDGEKNTNGTYNCTINEKNKVANYSAKDAPIVIPINTPGYSAQTAPTSYNPQEVKNYTDSGIIYVYPGCRGRDNGDNFTGGAPWGVTDLKASIMYLKFNKDIIPGDTEKIFTFGHSGGGAQSAIVGSSGDNELYESYLEAIGAAMTDQNGYVISSSVYGSMCWCPITNLDTADEGYEWYMGQYTRSNDTWTYELSKDLAMKYGEYINKLGLKDPSGKTLTLDKSNDGIYTSGSYYDYQISVIEESLNNFLADTTFPYTPSNDMKSMGGSPLGNAPTGEMPTGEAPAGDVPNGELPAGNIQNNGTSTNSNETYQTAQDYINSLNSDRKWIEYDASKKTVKIKSIESFVKHCKTPTKSVPAFDDLNRSQAENSVFGNNKSNTLHFDSTIAELLSSNNDKYSKLNGYNSSYASEYAHDIKVTDQFNYTVEDRVNMYNPMYYLCDYYNSSTSNPAKHWRINSGIEQGDTATTVESNLALALNQSGKTDSVELNVVWVQGHTQAERSGDANSNFISWINKCVS